MKHLILAAKAGDKTALDNVKEIVADYEEELAARGIVVDKNKKHIPMSELLKQDKVVNLSRRSTAGYV